MQNRQIITLANLLHLSYDDMHRLNDSAGYITGRGKFSHKKWAIEGSNL